MALDFEIKRFALNTSTGDQSVTTSFQPKLVILFMGLTSSDDAWATHAQKVIGFLTEHGGAKQVVCCAAFDENGLGTSDTCCTARSARALYGFSDATTPTVDFEVGAPSGTMFGATSFTINISDAPSSAWKVEAWVFGGSDITAACAGISSFAAATPVDITVNTGFGQPDFIFFASIGAGTPVDTNGVHAKIGFGVAKSDTVRACVSSFSQDALGSMGGGTFLAARSVQGFRSTTSVTNEFEYDLDAVANWPTDGFRIVRQAGTGTQGDNQILWIALRGTFQSAIGLVDCPTSAGNQDWDPGFVPVFAGFFTDGIASHSAVNTTDADGFCLGGFGGSTQSVVCHLMNDGNTTQTSRNRHDTNAAVLFGDANNGADPTITGEASCSFPSGNTVRLNWGTAPAAARQYGRFALGSAAGAADASLVFNPAPMRALIVR